MIQADIASQLALDVNGLAQTKRLAKDDPRAAMKSAAQQFEAVFLQMVLKLSLIHISEPTRPY